MMVKCLMFVCVANIDSESFHPFGTYILPYGWSTNPPPWRTPRNSWPYDQGLWRPLVSLNKAGCSTLVSGGASCEGCWLISHNPWSLLRGISQPKGKRITLFVKNRLHAHHALQCSSHSLSWFVFFWWGVSYLWLENCLASAGFLNHQR